MFSLVVACGGDTPGPGATLGTSADGGGTAGSGGGVDAGPAFGADAAVNPSDPTPTGADAAIGAPGDDGGAAADPCAAVSCGSGRCSAASGEAVCECPLHFVGAACDSCARGYTGRDCGSCVDGYLSDGAGGCMVDPCSNLACQNGAACASDGPTARCDCPPQFTGAQCERCAPGHTGPGCTSCLNGYQRVNGVCVVVVCSGFECNGGTCKDVAGQPTCTCKPGYQGTHCEECAPGYSRFRETCSLVLPTVGVPVLEWFDGAATGTMDINAMGDVRVWRARNNPDKRFRGHFVNDGRLPRYSAETRGLVFDGDVMNSFSDLLQQKQHYAIYMVARWNKAAAAQTILRAYETSDGIEGLRLAVKGPTGRFVHRSLPNSAADEVSADLFAEGGPVHLFIAKRAPFGNGTAHVISNGVAQKAAVAQSLGNIPPLLVVLGMVIPSPSEPEALRGTVHEIIIMGAPPSADDEKKILSYLKVKWGL